MMLVHRSSKGRNSGQRNGDGVYIGHEKIVDIAGIGFVEVEAPRPRDRCLAPERGTQPGDTNAADFDTNSKSLGSERGYDVHALEQQDARQSSAQGRLKESKVHRWSRL